MTPDRKNACEALAAEPDSCGLVPIGACGAGPPGVAEVDEEELDAGGGEGEVIPLGANGLLLGLRLDVLARDMSWSIMGLVETDSQWD